MRKTFALFILLAVAFAGCAPGPAQQPPAAPKAGVAVGSLAPGFTLSDLKGAAVAAPVPGKVTVLNFWTTWCPYCRDEMLELEKFAAAHKDVAFYAVNIMEPAAKADDFLRRNGYTMPVLLDGDGSVAQTYRASTIPTTLVIDKTGVVKFRKTGPLTAAELASLIRGL
jgi:thiol-disulfide isomerase/thioredoxin